MVAATPSYDINARAAFMVALVHAFLAFVLLRGLAGDDIEGPPERPRMVDLQVTPIPPEQEPPPPPERSDEAAPGEPTLALPDAPAPPALEAEPTPIVAPVPIVPIPLPPPPLPAAPVAGAGSAPSAGAAPIPGPGTGAGGSGAGRGGGGGGTGTGTGRAVVMPRHLRGDFSYSDIPADLRERGFRGRVGMRFMIDVDGRAKQCRIIRSSGSRAMDVSACRALEQRFRFAPARDAQGRPVPIPGEDNPWFEADEEPPDPPRGRRGRDEDW